ncbi:hypothetical protein WUBG_16068 [Wuchereria bancrofti]|uniref:GH18 domain-containing protein n=1 Tax=Wuchereria bancrofti TaxID=6293 RepID=J9AG57_WUCBA|nr:hypothetical protein WUBG_16068 [Wuchereria bancrofti]
MHNFSNKNSKPLIAMIIIKREETIYREGKFLPENIPNGLCTHILYAFAKVDELGDSKAFEWNDETECTQV